MGRFSEEKKKDGILPVFLWIFLVATVAVFLILTAALLSENGTLAEWKARYTAWKADREVAKQAERAGEKTVCYFGPSEEEAYENWFTDMWEDAVSDGSGDESGENAALAEKDPLREALTTSPVNGSEAWWSTAKKLSGDVTLYARGETPLYNEPRGDAAVCGYAAAGEQFRLLAIPEAGWYVVSDGEFYYCSQGDCYTLVPLQRTESASVFSALERQKVFHEVETILQEPELPHGCEVTGLAILLSYYGVEADKCELAEEWLPKGEWGQTDFREAFVGDPRRKKASAGCYAPVIADTANRYLKEGKPGSAGSGTGKTPEFAGNAGKLTAVARENVAFEELLLMLQEAPVLAWTTINLEAPYIAQVWEVDGEELYWQNLEHCVVLTGYDAEKGILYGTDPLYGPCEYAAELFSVRFQTMYSQVVQMVKDIP